MSKLVHLEEALFALNDLTGTIPEYFDTFIQLKKLSLLDNRFTGTLPDLPHLTKMTHLDLSNNQALTGTLPASWGEMHALRGLFLSFNGLTGSLPPRLGDLTELRDLRLSGNAFGGTVPASLGNCRHLHNLYLDDNALTGELGALRSLPFLEGVFLENNQFQGDFETFLEYFDDIVILDASNNELRGTLPPDFFQKDKLKVLDLSGNSIQGVLPNFPENDSLEYLALQYNAFGGTVPASIANLRALTHLDLSTNALTGPLPATLGDMGLLTYLNLSWNPLGPLGVGTPVPDMLRRLTALRELSLARTGLTGTIPEWIEEMQGLVLLDLAGNALEGTVPGRVFAEREELTFVLLFDNALEGTVPYELARLPKLRMLTVGENRFTGLASGFCREGLFLQSDKSIFSGDCDRIPAHCFVECCNEGKCPTSTQLQASQDLQWDHTYGYWFSFNERIVYDIRPMVAAGALAVEGYAQYQMQGVDYGVDDEDDGYFDDDDAYDDDDFNVDDFFDDDVVDDDYVEDDVEVDDDASDDDFFDDDVVDDDYVEDDVEVDDDATDDDFFEEDDAGDEKPIYRLEGDASGYFPDESGYFPANMDNVADDTADVEFDDNR